MAEYIKEMEEELDGAKCYYKKAKHDEKNKSIYKKMALEELSHFCYIKEIMLNDMSEEDKEQWNDVAQMLFNYWIDKYEHIKRKIEEL